MLKLASVMLEDVSCSLDGMFAVYCKELFLSLAKVALYVVLDIATWKCIGIRYVEDS